MADELVNGTQGHENESVNVAGLKATIKDAGNLGIFNKGVCSTAAGTAAKTVTVGSAFALGEDALILVRFANEVTSKNSTLSVNKSTAKPIYYHGEALEPNVIKADSEYIMRYDGSYWCIIGGMADREIEVEIGETSPVEDVKLFVDEDEDPVGAIDIYTKTQIDEMFEDVVRAGFVPRFNSTTGIMELDSVGGATIAPNSTTGIIEMTF